MSDTIFALSSGAPPAGIGVIRISGPQAGAALSQLIGALPPARQTRYCPFVDAQGLVLDRGVALWLPGQGNATGEDSAELHCHGGRAVIAAVEAALLAVPGLRRAKPGEFTRRAFANGKIDLAEAEGLADLLAAETELQRRMAMEMADGQTSSLLEVLRQLVLNCSAQVEAMLDFGDEDDVIASGNHRDSQIFDQLNRIEADLSDWLTRPRVEMLRDGFRVVLAGPPNAGKSTLFNALVEADAAITAAQAGTTRDLLTRPVSISGVPFLFADTAGLRDETDDAVEVEGIARARRALDGADLVLWLGEEGQGPAGNWEIAAQADLPNHANKQAPRHRISAVSGLGMDTLRQDLVTAAREALPKPGQAALNQRQHNLLAEARDAIQMARAEYDPLLIAENLRVARVAFDAILGRTATEDMLDALFGQFCIGK